MHYPVLFCLPYSVSICLPYPLSNCLPYSVSNCLPYPVINCFPYPVGIGTVEVQRGTMRCNKAQRPVTNVVILQRKRERKRKRNGNGNENENGNGNYEGADLIEFMRPDSCFSISTIRLSRSACCSSDTYPMFLAINS